MNNQELGNQKLGNQEQVEKFVNNVKREFSRLCSFNQNANATIDVEMNDSILFTFRGEKVVQIIEVPIPTETDEGVVLLYCGDVVRAACNYWLEQEQRELNFLDLMEHLFLKDPHIIFPEKNRASSFIHRIVKSFGTDRTAYTINLLRKAISEVIMQMPLHENNMGSWAKNKRLTIIDPSFYTNDMMDPNKRLDYQVDKNTTYYEKFGWSSIGLSDNTLADKNNILKVDLRATIPFGLHHNPQRNLYSTLDMKGDTLPKVRSKTMDTLIKQGISRTGWNFFVAVIDLDMVFEDQILVSNRHKDKGHTVERRYTIYNGESIVKVGDSINVGKPLGFSADLQPVIMDLRCDSCYIKGIKVSNSDVGGEKVNTTTITVEGFRFFKDATKLSNMAANKGVIRLMDLGVAINPKTGKEVDIDVIISASSINKRKNFSQIIEMITNTLYPDQEVIVVADDKTTTKEKLGMALEDAGYPSDGTWNIITPFGEFQTLCGKMFWGVTKDPEDQIWGDKKPLITNNRELRTSGLKLSHVEIKALTTRFGENNAILNEILSHAQGADILLDEINILKSICGKFVDAIRVNFTDVSYVDRSNGMFYSEEDISGTVVDENFMPNGFILDLPVEIQALVPVGSSNDFIFCIPQDIEAQDMFTEYRFDSIYIPNSFLRRCWKHSIGKYGISPLGAYINILVHKCHDFHRTKSIEDNLAIVKAALGYVKAVCRIMGSKNGDIANFGMSVRYPHSVRLTATLTNDLPENTVQIHRDVACKLGVNNGDPVLVERFPCLGFMSIRPQYISITDDIECLYSVRVSGNSLVSLDLDFDGDTIYLASFKTPAAIMLLYKELETPNEVCQIEIDKINNRKKPTTKAFSLDDFDITSFPKPTVEEHSSIVRRATGVKSHTGPVIALAYNLMRIVERNVSFEDTKQHVALEVMLHFLGNTVFKQKHGIESLQEAATDAVCMADVDKLVELGFEYTPSRLLCDIIVKEAGSVGINDLRRYHIKSKEMGYSKIINILVRKYNRIYFASRSVLDPFSMVEHLECDAVDLPSRMLKTVLLTKLESTEVRLKKIGLEKAFNKARIGLAAVKDVCGELFNYVDAIMIKKEE